MMGRTFTSLLAACAVTFCALPAVASTLAPLDLKRGQGTVGGGIIMVAGDVAIADGLSLGVTGFGGLMTTGAQGRATWTCGQGGAGAIGLMAAAGPMQSGYYGSDPLIRTRFAAMLGPVYESPPWMVRVRAGLVPGVMVGQRTNYDALSFDASEGQMPDPVILSEDTIYSLSVWPMLEVVVPIGQHFELTVGGNQLVGVFGRW